MVSSMPSLSQNLFEIPKIRPKSRKYFRNLVKYPPNVYGNAVITVKYFRNQENMSEILKIFPKLTKIIPRSKKYLAGQMFTSRTPLT